MNSIWLIIYCLIHCGTPYKFLAYSPQFGRSHVNFMAKITDVLVDAGHEVVMLSEVFDRYVGGPHTAKARITPTGRALEIEQLMSSTLSADFWAAQTVAQFFNAWSVLIDVTAESCIVSLLTVAIESRTDGRVASRELRCGLLGIFAYLCTKNQSYNLTVLFHHLGIEKFAITDSLAMLDAWFHYTQTPSIPSYVPCVLSFRSGENMTFFDRLHNTYVFALAHYYTQTNIRRFEEIFSGKVSGFPPLLEIISRNSLVFTNSEPLIDFPRPSSSRIIEIGGIVATAEHEPLNGTWSAILDLRPHTIFISFGSVALAHQMPETYKRSIIDAVKRFPDVTFIWKYENPAHNISRGIDNLIESTWVPQRDMLHDSRLSAFITHCGQSSTTEAIDAGIPLIVVPVMGDQYRNAHLVLRNGIGLMLDKTQLSTPDALEDAIRHILSTHKYRERALQMRQMIRERPFPMRQIFVRNMEFLAAHGPLRQLDHFGRNLNFAQYYLVDVIGFVTGVALVSIACVLLASYWILRAGFSKLGKVALMKQKIAYFIVTMRRQR